jgi:hypothetical protein
VEEAHETEFGEPMIVPLPASHSGLVRRMQSRSLLHIRPNLFHLQEVL